MLTEGAAGLTLGSSPSLSCLSRRSVRRIGVSAPRKSHQGGGFVGEEIAWGRQHFFAAGRSGGLIVIVVSQEVTVFTIMGSLVVNSSPIIRIWWIF